MNAFQDTLHEGSCKQVCMTMNNGINVICTSDNLGRKDCEYHELVPDLNMTIHESVMKDYLKL